VFTVSYSGSHGVHLYDIANVNPANGGSVYLGDARAANRLNYTYSNMNFRSSNGYSHYNGLSVQFRTNNIAKTGVSLTSAYTWSHSLDNLSSTFTDGAPSNYYLGYLDAFNPSLGWGNSDFDLRHRLNVAGTWDIPFAKHMSNGVLKDILDGWSIGSSFTVRAGQPFSIFDETHYNGTSAPLWVAPTGVATTGSAVAVAGESNVFDYIALPNTAGKITNLGVGLGIPVCTGLDHVGCTYTTNGAPYPHRNQYVGPGFWNNDTSFYKNFGITERFKLQFRAEMYNLFNHHNQYINLYNLDVKSLSSAATPFVQSYKGGTGGPGDERRNIQLGLKLSF